MPGRLTSSHFVGRQGELAELELAAADAAEGRAGAVVVGGDSGLGKTRLIAELTDRLAGRAIVLRGEAIEQGDAELPYAPLLAALRPLVRAQDPALRELSGGTRELLAHLLPSLRDPLAAGPAGRTPPRGIANAEVGQLQLFEALLELLELISRREPVVLVVEDVHWAERSTRAFLGFLVANLRTERILVVLSYRTDELHRRHPLLSLLADLDRLPGVRRLTLVPFDRHELSEALTDILGTAPDATLLDRLLVRSEGNPLYVEELLAAGLDGRGGPPQSLRDAIMLRIERLSADARAVTRIVATAVRASQELIGQTAGLDSDRLRDALRETLTEHVLTTDEDRFRFRHALLREAVYDDLLPGERTELHRAIAEALAAGAPGSFTAHPEDEADQAGQIASHYAAAGDQPAALTATVAAARAAAAVHAYADAADLAERALELWSRVPDAQQLVGMDEAELLERAADVHLMSDNRSRGEQLLRRAIDRVPESEPHRLGVLLSELGRTSWGLNRGEEALELAERALALIPPGEGDADRALVQAWLARTQFLRGRFREARVDAQTALASGRATGDPCVIGESLNTLGMANISLGDVELGVTQLRESIDVAASSEIVDNLGSAYVNLADLLLLAGRTQDALAVAAEGSAAIAHTSGRARNFLELTHSLIAFEAGDWRTAAALSGPPRERLQGTPRILGLLRDAELALGTGDHAGAADALEAAEPLVRMSSEAQWHGQFGSLLGELRRREGDLAAAQQAVTEVERLELCTDDVMRIARISAVGVAVEADRAVRARDLHDEASERDSIARAEIHLSRLAAAAAAGGAVGLAWLAFGEADGGRARGASGPEAWSRAADAFDALHRPYPATAARWRQVEALVETGDRDAAAQVAAEAIAVARELGAGWLTGELDALIARARLSVHAAGTDRTPQEDGAGDADAPPPGGDAAPFGLTPRELQVLALVAGGATNRQIGATLFMAEKTASVHVSRILAKLGVSSRTQAAAVAHRMHLVALAERVR